MDDQGQPTALTWKQREPVREVVNRWRVDDDWWRAAISRTYLWLRTSTMMPEVNCEDLCTGDWYIERVID